MLMTKHFCDRCGKEAQKTQTYKKPYEVTEFGDYKCKEVDLCDECYGFVDRAVKEYNKSMSNVRVAFFKTLIPRKE